VIPGKVMSCRIFGAQSDTGVGFPARSYSTNCSTFINPIDAIQSRR
jgi:hypothetical protein